MCKPTLRQLHNVKNHAEVQDQIYRLLKPAEGDFNLCVMHSANNFEVADCADTFIKKLNDSRTSIANILRQY
jgi:hypothetical protein